MGRRSTIRGVSRAATMVAGLAATVTAVQQAASGGPSAVAVLVVFAVAPDLTMVIGAGDGAEPGVLPARAVPLYNLFHRAWSPLLLVALSAVAAAPVGVIAGCAWFAHVAFDRVAGYGLRTADGRQRHERQAVNTARPVPR